MSSLGHNTVWGKMLAYLIHYNFYTLQWRHNGRDAVSNHQPHDCLLHRIFKRRSKKTSKLRVTGLCAGNSPGTGEFPAQMASNAEDVSIWWRHHGVRKLAALWLDWAVNGYEWLVCMCPVNVEFTRPTIPSALVHGLLQMHRREDLPMLTSSKGNIFRVIGPLWGEFIGHRWIPLTKASDAERWCFLWSAPE